MKESDIEIHSFRKKIGDRIEYIRIKEGISKEKFAKLIGMTGQQLGSIIRGECGFSIEKLIEISNISGYSTDFILFGRKMSNEVIIKQIEEIENKINELKRNLI